MSQLEEYGLIVKQSLSRNRFGWLRAEISFGREPKWLRITNLGKEQVLLFR